MATVEFARAFRRHVDCPPERVEAETLGAALDAYFAHHPAVRSYVLDDQGRFRKHVTLFVDNEQVDHVRGTATPLSSTSTVHIFQALSGG